MHQLFAIVEDDLGRAVRRVPVEGDLQKDLSGEFERQRNALIEDVTAVAYDPGYKPDDDEVLVIEGYSMPGYLEQALKNRDALPAVDDADLEGGQVKSVFGVRLAARSPRQLIFQSFNAGQVLHRGSRYIFLSGETFERSDRVGLRLDDKASAVLEGGDLYFRSEHVVRRFLDLDAYFQQATDDEIGKLLDHRSFAPCDQQVLVDLADRWIRRKVTSIRNRAILDKVAVSIIVEVGEEFGLPVLTKTIRGRDRIVFPEDKKQVKALLRFLDDDLLESPLTDARYQVTSKRRL